MRSFLISDKEESHNHSHDEGLHSNKILLLSIILFVFAFILERTSLLEANPLKDVYIMVFSLVPYIMVGYKTIFTAFRNLRNKDIFGESFLMTLATFGAIAIGESPEAAAVMVLYNIGEYFQGKAVAKSRKSISELMDIRPDFANLEKIDGSIKKVSPEELKKGDTIIIKSGEKIPVDATVIDGFTTIDNKALTGESMPVEVATGDKIISGAINITGLIKARVDREFSESTVSKILELVQNASEKKSTQEKFITKFSKVYTPIVVLLAILIILIPTVFYAEPFSKWLSRALIFLVISCPCALVISVPLSFFAGIGGASKRGILFKGSTYIEQLAKISSVMFDKTGTLTKGKFEVSDIIPEDGYSQEELLKLAAYAEYNSNHPIAKSIVNEYQKRIKASISTVNVTAKEILGFGVVANIDGADIVVGNAKMMDRYGISAKDVDKTVIYIAKDFKYIGYITIEDKIKDDAKEAIFALNQKKIDSIMLTGDNEKIASKVAKELGLSRYYAELLPQDKVEKLEIEINNSKENEKIAFVGDGINDAPVLARADLGIAMGAIGSDAAIEAADIVLMTDEISKISEAIDISKKTISVAMQNIILAIGIKIVVMVLGVFGLANMWVAVFADVGVSIIAVFNAMRAYNTKV